MARALSVKELLKYAVRKAINQKDTKVHQGNTCR